MYIGIYISDDFISAGTLNQDGEILLIQDENNSQKQGFLTPLRICMEEDYVYLGKPVELLLANDHTLETIKFSLDDLSNNDKVLYRDSTGVGWNAVAVFALFLKKLIADIQVVNDHPVKGAVATIIRPITGTLTEALLKAFQIADITLCGVIDIGKSALLGYGVTCSSNKGKTVLQYNLDHSSATISLLTMAEENYCTAQFLRTNPKLGSSVLEHYLLLFLVKRYKEITTKDIKKNRKNEMALKEFVQELLRNYATGSQLFTKIVCAFDVPVIEILVTRSQLHAIYAKYLQQTVLFLKECLTEIEIDSGGIDEILITGVFPFSNILQGTLNEVFLEERIKIHNHLPDEIITRGVTLYANTTVEREISASLLSKVGKEPTTDQDNSGQNENNTPDIKKMTALVSAMHINLGCDVQF